MTRSGERAAIVGAMRIERVRYVERGAMSLACFGLGVLAAVFLAGCGGSGGGSIAGQVSSTGQKASVTRPGATETRDAATETRQPVTETRDAAATVAPPATTGAPIQSVATVTETRGSVTVNHVTSVGVTVSGVTPQTTAAETTVDTSGTPAWVWIVVAAGAGALIALVVWLLRRGSNDNGLAERQRLVAATVNGWTAQGWAIESQTESSAVLRQNGERLLINVEPDGRISSRRLGFPSEPPSPRGGWADGA